MAGQAVSFQQLPGLVQGLIQSSRLADAAALVAAFAEKGVAHAGVVSTLVQALSQADELGPLANLERVFARFLPKTKQTRRFLYLIQNARRDWKSAESSLLALIDDEPEKTDLRLALASLYERIMRPEEALQVLALLNCAQLKGEDLSRWCLLSVKSLVQLKRFDEAASILREQLPSLAENKYTAACNKEQGKLLDRGADYDAAFDAFRAGNEMLARVAGIAIEENAFRRRVEVMRAVFEPEWVRQSLLKSDVFSSGNKETQPVFLIGFPRSGTTLLEQVLDSHPNIQAMEERGAVEQTYRFARMLMAATESQALPKIPAHDWKQREVVLNQAIAKLTPEQRQSVRDRYWEEVGKYVKRDESKIFIDKMPLNISMVGFLRVIFPQSRFILALRHPCDCVLSAYMQPFELNPAMENMVSLEWAASSYKHLMALMFQLDEAFSLGEQVHQIKYESLVRQFEPTTKAVLAFLGVEWNETVKDFDQHARSRELLSTPSYTGVTQKLYTAAAGRWQHYSEHLRPVLPHFGQAAARFGYDLSSTKEARGATDQA